MGSGYCSLDCCQYAQCTGTAALIFCVGEEHLCAVNLATQLARLRVVCMPLMKGTEPFLKTWKSFLKGEWTLWPIKF